jgi:peptide deformylase
VPSSLPGIAAARFSDIGYHFGMALRPIVKWGDPVLHAPSAPVKEIDGSLNALVTDMVQTMYAAPGIGLAAPQIGVPLRVIVIDLSVGEEKGQLITLVNPEFVEREGEQRQEEGCLSLPGFGGTPVRPAKVVVKGLDLEGKERIYPATELLARAFCHEIDHIDGLLFVDRLTPLKRDLMKRKLRKKARADDWDE